MDGKAAIRRVRGADQQPLALKRGSEGDNPFGPPRRTPGWQKALGIVPILFLVLGVVG